MKVDEYINDFIDRQKDIKPNPFLSTRIMAKIENSISAQPVAKKASFWQTAALAVSIISVVISGVFIGNALSIDTQNSNVININDRQIENLNLYQFSENE